MNRRREEYMRGGGHTNTVEGAFSLFKRSIVGSFHQISHKHLDRYLDEFEFRFNNRKNEFLFRDTILRLIEGENCRTETSQRSQPLIETDQVIKFSLQAEHKFRSFAVGALPKV